jgi:hypothetical protein
VWWEGKSDESQEESKEDAWTRVVFGTSDVTVPGAPPCPWLGSTGRDSTHLVCVSCLTRFSCPLRDHCSLYRVMHKQTKEKMILSWMWRLNPRPFGEAGAKGFTR